MHLTVRCRAHRHRSDRNLPCCGSRWGVSQVRTAMWRLEVVQEAFFSLTCVLFVMMGRKKALMKARLIFLAGSNACLLAMLLVRLAVLQHTVSSALSSHRTDLARTQKLMQSRLYTELCSAVHCKNVTQLECSALDALFGVSLSAFAQRSLLKGDGNSSISVERVSMVLAKRAGESCEKVCTQRSMLCAEWAFDAINSCDKLGLAAGCELCSKIADPTHIGLPGVVRLVHSLQHAQHNGSIGSHAAFPAFFDGRCLCRLLPNAATSPATTPVLENELPRCGLSHKELQRLCPCVRKESEETRRIGTRSQPVAQSSTATESASP